MRTGWRMVKEKYARDAFSGDGARLSGGRWNHKGISVIYAAEHLSLSALETFVQMGRREVNSRFVGIPFSYPDTLRIEDLKAGDLPKEWRSTPPGAQTKDVGKKWIEGRKSVILRVPSVVVPQEFNFVINPNHPDFKHLTIGKPVGFSFDPRMWK